MARPAAAQFWSRKRLTRLIKLALACTAAFAAVWILPIWVYSLFDANIPRWLKREMAVAFLTGMLAAYYLALLGMATGLGLAVVALRRARRRNKPRPAWVIRVLAGSLVYAAGLAILETGAVVWERTSNEIAAPPAAANEPPPEEDAGIPHAFGQPPRAAGRDLYMVVLGESSARGEPYQPWLSVGQILGWELEKVFPGRRVEVDVRAYGGAPLQPMVKILAGLKRRPDAVLVYSGHNEFQSRFYWGRRLSYYADDLVEEPRKVVISAAIAATPLCRLIRDTLEYQQLDEPPPPIVPQGVVDHPAYTVEEYARVRENFYRQLEAIVSHCERIGALPILVIPAGNDAGFSPNRSLLDPRSRKANRKAFAIALAKARTKERDDPAGAIHLYDELLKQEPRCAELHYRLGGLLEQTGNWETARIHQLRARDLDAFPMRCPTDFQDVYRRLAARHDVVLVDGEEVLRALSPHRMLDDHLFHDGQHPTLWSYVALAQTALDALKSRGAFGWPNDRPAAVIDPAECARRAGINRERWILVCRRAAHFYRTVAPLRNDSADRELKARKSLSAADAIARGRAVEDAGLPGLGVHPTDVLPPQRKLGTLAAGRPAPVAHDSKRGAG